MTRVTLGKSRVRETRMPGSVRAKAEWLSYSTVIRDMNISTNRDTQKRLRRKDRLRAIEPSCVDRLDAC